MRFLNGHTIRDAITGLSAAVEARKQTPTGNALNVQIGPGDPVQVGILVIEDVLPAESIPALAEAQQPTPEDLGAACVASDLPTEDAAAKLAEAGLDVVLPE